MTTLAIPIALALPVGFRETVPIVPIAKPILQLGPR